MYPDISISNKTAAIRIPSGINSQEVALIYICLNIQNSANISALINHATKWDSKLIQLNVTNANPATSTWSGTTMTLTVPLLEDVTTVYASECYILKLQD